MKKTRQTKTASVRAFNVTDALRRAHREWSTLIIDSVKLDRKAPKIKGRSRYIVRMHRRVKRLGKTRKFGGKVYLQREIKFNKHTRNLARARAKSEGWMVRVTPLGKDAYVIWVRKKK